MSGAAVLEISSVSPMLESATFESPTLESIEADVALVCGHLNAFHGQLVALTERALATGVPDQHGLSPAQWLAWKTGLSLGRARQIVQMAERRAELPVTFAALSDGELAVDQAAVLARHCPAFNDAEVCEFARYATVSQLQRKWKA